MPLAPGSLAIVSTNTDVWYRYGSYNEERWRWAFEVDRGTACVVLRVLSWNGPDGMWCDVITPIGVGAAIIMFNEVVG
jgi:hypothetical protein